jgi:hypothetical protein
MNRMAFAFRLETTDGRPAEPSTLESAVPDWRIGHSIHLGDRTLQVVGVRADDADQPPVLVVEEVYPIPARRRDRLETGGRQHSLVDRRLGMSSRCD